MWYYLLPNGSYIRCSVLSFVQSHMFIIHITRIYIITCTIVKICFWCVIPYTPQLLQWLTLYKWWPAWRATQRMPPQRSNVAWDCSMRVTLLPRGDICHVTQSARWPFIILHRKSLMGNCIQEFRFFLNKIKNKEQAQYIFSWNVFIWIYSTKP